MACPAGRPIEESGNDLLQATAQARTRLMPARISCTTARASSRAVWATLRVDAGPLVAHLAVGQLLVAGSQKSIAGSRVRWWRRNFFSKSGSRLRNCRSKLAKFLPAGVIVWTGPSRTGKPGRHLAGHFLGQQETSRPSAGRPACGGFPHSGPRRRAHRRCAGGPRSNGTWAVRGAAGSSRRRRRRFQESGMSRGPAPWSQCRSRHRAGPAWDWAAGLGQAEAKVASPATGALGGVSLRGLGREQSKRASVPAGVRIRGRVHWITVLCRAKVSRTQSSVSVCHAPHEHGPTRMSHGSLRAL